MESAISNPRSAIASAWPPDRWRHVHVLVAVSGGADSVAMLRALADLKQLAGGRGRLFVAHYNHKLRGQDSDADARWVPQLAEQLGAKAVVGQAAAENQLANEQQARDARYDFLSNTAHELGARYVATGHTADDQVETILHRLLRGSGLAGLRGIPFSRPLSESVEIVRPLLGVRRQEIEVYLETLGQEFRQDGTNTESTFTRNRIRQVVLPLLRQEIGRDVDQALRRLSQQATEAHEILGKLAAEAAGAAVVYDKASERLVIEPDALTGLPPLLAREACKLAWRGAGWPEQAMGSHEWVRLVALLNDSDAPHFDLPGGVQARHTTEGVELRRRGSL